MGKLVTENLVAESPAELISDMNHQIEESYLVSSPKIKTNPIVRHIIMKL